MVRGYESFFIIVLLYLDGVSYQTVVLPVLENCMLSCFVYPGRIFY